MNYGISNQGACPSKCGGGKTASYGKSQACNDNRSSSTQGFNLAKSGCNSGNSNQKSLDKLVSQLKSTVSKFQGMMDKSSSNACGSSSSGEKAGGKSCGGASMVDQLQQQVSKLESFVSNNSNTNTNGGDKQCGYFGSQNSTNGQGGQDMQTMLNDIMQLLRALLSGMKEAGGHKGGSSAYSAQGDMANLVNKLKAVIGNYS